MIHELRVFYKRKGILSTSFTCGYQTQCRGNHKNFTGPKSSFVSTGYEIGSLPRLLFLSLDSGESDANNTDRLPLRIRNKLQAVDVCKLRHNTHWYRTHELAWYILRRFNPGLRVEDTKMCFAHVNSAKCCMNKEGKKKADRILFDNCRGYLLSEISILRPEIIVTQGHEAKIAIENLYDDWIKQLNHDEFASLISIGGDKVFWLHTYHPSNYGLFYQQRNFDTARNIAVGWDNYSKMIHRFIAKKHRESLRQHTIQC